MSHFNIADSAIDNLSSIIIRLEELAEQAASSTYGNQQRKALDAREIDIILNELGVEFRERVYTPDVLVGGIESTATDYAGFMDMLLNGGVDRVSGTRVLAAESVEEMLSQQTIDGQPIAFSPTGNNRYGIGVWLDQLGDAEPEVDVLASGARGFHSWIDYSHGLVFVFSTDLTRFPNVEMLSSKMHAVIVAAIVPEPASWTMMMFAVATAVCFPRRGC